jgi:hypothetical protein
MEKQLIPWLVLVSMVGAMVAMWLAKAWQRIRYRRIVRRRMAGGNGSRPWQPLVGNWIQSCLPRYWKASSWGPDFARALRAGNKRRKER